MRKALQSLPWVRQVQVYFDTKQAIVTADADQYDEKTLLDTLKKAGYGGKIVK